MNQQRQMTNLDLFEFIGRQALEIDFLRKQAEQFQALAQSEQNRANEAQGVADEAQLLAKRLYHQQNGADKKQAVQTPT